MLKCVGIGSEYEKEKERSVQQKRLVDDIREGEYLRAAASFREIKGLISDYVSEASILSSREKEYRRRLERMDEEIADLSSRLSACEDDYSETVRAKKIRDERLSGLIRRNQDLSDDLMMKQLSTLALESCSKVGEKEILGLKDTLRELEDNTRCLVGMISLENTAVLSVRAEYAQINEQKKRMEKSMESEIERLVRTGKDSRTRIEQLSRKLAASKRLQQQLKGEEESCIARIERLNEQLASIRGRTQAEDSSLDMIHSRLSATKEQLARLQDKRLAIRYLWEEAGEDCDLQLALEDEQVVEQAKRKFGAQSIDISDYMRENGELMIAKNGLVEEIEVLKQKLSERDFNSDKKQRIEAELLEKISKARALNAELLRRQRELSSKEDRVLENKQRLSKVKTRLEEIARRKGEEAR